MADPSPATRRSSDRRCSTCGKEGHNARTCKDSSTAPLDEQCARPTCHQRRARGRKWCADCLACARESTQRRRDKLGRPRVNYCDLCQKPHSVLDCPDYTPTEPLPPSPAAPEIAPLEDPSPEAAPEPEDEDQDLGPLPSRPQTRGDCKDGIRPCPWMSCHFHLLTLVSQGGEGPGNSGPVINALSLPGLRKQPSSIKWKLSPLTDQQAGAAAAAAIARLDALGASCVLDIADQGGQTLDQVAQILGVVRERIRQIEVKALASLREEGEDLGEDGDDD